MIYPNIMNMLFRKKKLIVILVLVIITGVIVGVYNYISTSKNSSIKIDSVPLTDQEASVLDGDKSSAFEDLSQPEVGVPKSISINSKRIETDIVIVGKDDAGYMETPVNWKLAGWYSLSSKTAQNGNIIINGHYDDNFGRPAAFSQLKTVTVGDNISIVDEFNRPFDYTVTEVYYLSIDDPDRFKIFNYQRGTQTLTLITCGGVWLPADNTYNKRLVVRALRTK